jgi:hypothetical protein
MTDPTSLPLTTAERIALILAIALIAVLVPGTIPLRNARLCQALLSASDPHWPSCWPTKSKGRSR